MNDVAIATKHNNAIINAQHAVNDNLVLRTTKHCYATHDILLGIDPAHNDNIVAKAEHGQHAVALDMELEALANANKKFYVV